MKGSVNMTVWSEERKLMFTKDVQREVAQDA